MSITPSSIDPTRPLEEQIHQASPDLLRELLQTFINTLLSAEAYAVCGASRHDRGGRHPKLVGSSGTENLSESRISQMAGELDEQAAAFRTRPLDSGPCTFVAADALMRTVREAGRVAPVHALAAHQASTLTGVATSWDCRSPPRGRRRLRGTFGDLVARGLTGVKLVASDAQPGLKAARSRQSLSGPS